jgi:hypothetical protein
VRNKAKPAELTLPPVFIAIYDLRRGGWEMATRHAKLWGSLYVKSTYLAGDRIGVEFYASGRPLWRKFEEKRLQTIFDELWPSVKAGAQDD